MKKYLIEWETCYCEDYPEQQGEYIVQAENKQAAIKKFNIFHAIITNISEVK